MLKLFAALHPSCPFTNTHTASIQLLLTLIFIIRHGSNRKMVLASSSSREVRHFQIVAQVPTAQISARNLLEMQIFRHLPRHAKSENLGVGVQQSALWSPSGDSNGSSDAQLKNHCSQATSCRDWVRYYQGDKSALAGLPWWCSG